MKLNFVLTTAALLFSKAQAVLAGCINTVTVYPNEKQMVSCMGVGIFDSDDNYLPGSPLFMTNGTQQFDQFQCLAAMGTFTLMNAGAHFHGQSCFQNITFSTENNELTGYALADPAAGLQSCTSLSNGTSLFGKMAKNGTVIEFDLNTNSAVSW